MSEQKYNCDRVCPCKDMTMPMELIVLTGGPGAGKTAALEFIRKVLCEHIAILPEAASILFGGGFWRLDSTSARKASQRAIYHVQVETQNLVLQENKWAMGLCDRGTLDGLAYWPGTESEFYHSLNTNRDAEYAKYKAVIHLKSPNVKQGYNHQNPIRTESARVAAHIDQQIHEVWKNHPNYTVVNSTSEFVDKVHSVVEQVRALMPECCRKHLMDTADSEIKSGTHVSQS